MKKHFYILTILVVASTLYAGWATYAMLYNNKTPYTVECRGVLLDSNKVMAISNNEKHSKDTLFIHFERSKVIMPATLGYIYFDKQKAEFVLKNNVCVFDPSKDDPTNYFLPFARTLNDGKFSKGKYFGGSEIIGQNILLKTGVKYNSSVGTPENRVSIELIKFNNQIFLKTKDDGIGTKYLIQSHTKNAYDVLLNQSTTTSSPSVFFFDNTTLTSAKYTLEIKATTFEASYRIADSVGRTLKASKGSNPTFIIGGYLFSITPKYGSQFFIAFVMYFLCIIIFQIYFLRLFVSTNSPVIKALFCIRILLNCLVFLAVPLFLTSYYLTTGRSYYLALILLLNLSFFISKLFLHNLDLSKQSYWHAKIIWGVVLVTLILVKCFTTNESLFGLIPVLHIQKVIILLIIFVTQDNFLKSFKNRYWLRIAFIMLFAVIISTITSDIGSFIYTALAFLLVELVRKTIKLRTAILSVMSLIALVYIFYVSFPSKLSERKYYRIVAPYTNPESGNLMTANQADRESYSSLLLNLKNILEFESPAFNNVVIPANMRSTCHSDFAFHWSFSLGGFSFFVLFMVAIVMLISNLTLLLFCSIRECQIGENRSFTFPNTRESELVRFLLAFTIISLIYPVASNMLIIPLTGQSIPCLSISNIEVIFLILLLVSLSSVFTNKKYISVKSTTKYYYSDAKTSIKYSLFCVIAILTFAFVFRTISLYRLDHSMTWKKHLTDENIKLNKQIPNCDDKEGLVMFGKNIIGEDDLTKVDKRKKPILKNLASLYYSNKPYTETIYDSKIFNNSTRKLLSQMTVDSIFTIKSKLISGILQPFGPVYAFGQNVNNKQVTKTTNIYYSSIPFDAQTINADLSAECARELEAHLSMIGRPGNIGSIMIVENATGGVLANSSYPLISEVNSNEVYYFIGSLKKLLVAYAALKIDASYYRNKSYNGKSFQFFLKYSDDYYAAALLKDLLQKHMSDLNEVLTNDFDIPLYSITDDSYMDIMPTENDYKKELNRNNTIYRQAIGQQKPYKLSQAVLWYARVSKGLKIQLCYTKEDKTYAHQTLGVEERKYLFISLNKVLEGTAKGVGIAMKEKSINTDGIICKTGTAEKPDRQGNASSSFILANANYTIGIMLKGTIPSNKKDLAAKNLFVSIIPILKKYEILK